MRTPRRSKTVLSSSLLQLEYNQHVDPKPRPNDERYYAVLRAMTPEQRLLKAFELSDFTMALFWEGMRHRNPNLTPDQLHRKGIEQLIAWRSSNS